MNEKKKAVFSILFFWFYILFICRSAYAKDKVNLDVIGRWGNIGSILCIETLQNNNNSYAYCGTTRGLLILDVTDPSSVQKNTFLEIGRVNDIAFYNSTYDSNKYAVLATKKGICIFFLHDLTHPTFTGFYDTDGWAMSITLSPDGRYAFVVDDYSGFVIIDIHDPAYPTFTGGYDTWFAKDIALSSDGRYAFMAGGYNGLIIIDIQDPTSPSYVGRYNTAGYARSIALSSDEKYAFVADWLNGLVIIDIQDPTNPTLIEDYGTWDIQGVALYPDEKYAFVADDDNGLVILQIIDTSQPQGNLIICPSGPASLRNPFWSPSQGVANLAYSTFLDHHYPHYFTYYFNPNPYPDIDGDGILDPFTVDDFDPMVADLGYTITDWAYNRLNEGPLYLYLIGLGTEDAYQIMPRQIIKAQDPNDFNSALNHYLNVFQRGTNRDIICLFEFASSGTFCDDLIDTNTLSYSRTIITCTDEGYSCLDLKGEESFTGILLKLLQDSNQPGLFEDTGISFTERVKLLQGLFSQAREIFWDEDKPHSYIFRTQPPRWLLP